ncbi:YkgJ family cysteine cluster protein [Candidatus Woesearchaeota archaeon]|nr:YkgJ family cysteine cluster protein [Candidatus Woesearchaeota archaeon]
MHNNPLQKENTTPLAIEARNSLGSYCFTECHAYCCRKGYLILTPKEADLLSPNNKKESILNKTIIPLHGGKYVLDLGSKDGCPQLQEHKCNIHTNPERPLACKEFPLFIKGNTIRLSRRCPAVRENILYPYLAQFKLLGYTLAYGNDNFRE